MDISHRRRKATGLVDYILAMGICPSLVSIRNYYIIFINQGRAQAYKKIEMNLPRPHFIPTMHLIRNGAPVCGKDGAGFTTLSKVAGHRKPCPACLELGTAPTTKDFEDLKVINGELKSYIEFMPDHYKHKLRLHNIQIKMEKILNK